MTSTDESTSVDRYCGALKKQPDYEGDWCHRPKGWGTDHPGHGKCKLHGGSHANGRKAAGKEAAAAAVRKLGMPLDIDPHTALLNQVKESAGNVEFYRNVVATIDQDDLVWGLTKSVVGGKDHGKTYQAAPNIWLERYDSERKHLAQVSALAIKAGVDERRLELEKQQSTAISGAFFAMLDALNLTDEQRVTALETFPRLLEQIGREGN